MRIGLDFDNTIIRYDDVFRAAAQQRRLLPAEFNGSKQQVRDAIRLLPDGELKWQSLQGYVYGKGIDAAQPFPGVSDFLRRAKAAGDTVLIISHKTVHGHHDPDRIDLRQVALGWMAARKFFARDGMAIQPEDVHFLPTRAEKLAKISELECDAFVDDLPEVLDDPAFPGSVQRILLSEKEAVLPYPVCPNWSSVEEVLFAGR